MKQTDLSKLTREQKLELLSTVEEKELRNKRKRDSFTPNKLQEKVFKSNKKIKIVTAGNGSGKTSLGVQFAWSRATGYCPITKSYSKVPIKIYVVLDNASKVESVWMPELRKWFDLDYEGVTLNKHGKTYTSEVKWKNGSSLTFLSWEMDGTVFESVQADLLLFDEPVPRNIFIALSRGQRSKKVAYETLIIGTPVTQEAAWLREDFIEPWKEGLLPNVECFTGSTSENEANLADGYLTRFSSLLTEKEKAIRLHGEFAHMDGLAFADLYKPGIHDIDSKEVKWGASWPCVLSIDPHPSKAHVALLLGRRPTDGRLFALAELTAKQTAREFAFSLHKLTKEFRVVDIICDSLGSADGTGNEGFKSFITILNECGLRARATTFHEKSHEATVDRIRSLLDIGPEDKGPKIQFLKDKVPGTIKELRNVGWLHNKHKDMNKDKLDYDKLDHFSTLAYALASNALSIINPVEKQIKYVKIGLGGSRKKTMRRNYYNFGEDE